MEWYSRSKEDFRELLYHKYQPMEENIWCLGIWESDTDYLLCNWDSDLLPPLIKKNEVRFEYNQWANKWSEVSCTIFAAMWMLSDLIDVEWTYDQIKEVDNLSYNNPDYLPMRTPWHWWYVKSAVDLVADWYNKSELAKKYGKVAYYRISKFDDEIIENVINKLYTIDWNMWLPTAFKQDYKEDWMVDWTNFWVNTNWHSIDIICRNWQRSVKDSYKWRKYNIYGLKNKLSAITNFWPYFYVYTLVREWAENDIKRLNEMKSKIVQAIDLNSQLWHLANDTTYKNLLHQMNEANRKKLDDIDNELKKYI